MDVNELNQIKKTIENMIDIGRLEEAIILINEYKKNIGFDDDIASMESVLYILKDKKEEALEKIREGLKVNIRNSDLYYNMGNIYENMGDYNRAYLCYEQAFYLCNDENSKENIIELLKIIKNNKNIEVKNTSIIILTYNQLEYTKLCVKSIRNNNLLGTYEIIIVDNNSTDGTVEWLKSQEDTDFKVIFNNENKGFPKGCNQGIEVANKDNDIMLLNNDTVVMPNSIFNLRLGLYSAERIGAVGSVSNNVSYYQQLMLNFSEFEEYMKFAEHNNVPNDKCYDERLKLVGFAMLINRKVIDRIKGFDERFTPGNYEDDDISYRIVNEKYKILLCKDSYIHHFGSVSFKKDMQKYLELLNRNRKKFFDKWKIDANKAFEIKINLNQVIDKDEGSILEIDSCLGATLINLRNTKKRLELYGYESEIYKDFYGKIGINYVRDISEKKLDNKFDYVFLHTYSKFKDKCFMDRIKNILKPNGKLIVLLNRYDNNNAINNNEFIEEFNEYMLKRRFECIELKPYVNTNDFEEMFFVYLGCEEKSIYEKVNTAIELGNIWEAEELIQVLKEYNYKNIDLQNNIDKYIELKFLLRRIDLGYDIEESQLNDILSEYPYEDEAVCNLIMREIINKKEVLNKIAIFNFMNKNYENVLIFLEKAYEIDNEDYDTLYNLAYVLKCYGEKELAEEYLHKIRKKDNEAEKLTVMLEGEE